jgi:tetraacyldisaccharide 4'-kinase
MLAYIYSLATDRRGGLVASIVKFFLFLLSLVYGFAVRVLVFIHALKRPRCLGCRAISVGNITLGGTGKTPLVLLIARHLKSKGCKVAVLTRGYKNKLSTSNFKTQASDYMGDEPYMLKMNLKDVPIVVNPDRISGANAAIADYGVDTVILDDGMQQWRIKKDLEIVTIDATNPFGNGSLLPRGILRQPVSCLKRADIIILTKVNLNPATAKIKNTLSKINPKSLIVESLHSPVGFCSIGKAGELLGLNAFQGKSVAIFSGIGDPDSFEGLIKNLGAHVAVSLKFPDHYSYTQKDLENILHEARQKGAGVVITTEKDAARIINSRVQAPYLQLLYLRIELRIIKKDEQGFLDRLSGLYIH